MAVTSTAVSVRKTELLSMHQDHGQPIGIFAARIKGKAQVCSFTKECSSADCWRLVDYTDDIFQYVLISGISDEDIKHDDLENKLFIETLSVIDNKEMAARAMSNTHRLQLKTLQFIRAVVNLNLMIILRPRWISKLHVNLVKCWLQNSNWGKQRSMSLPTAFNAVENFIPRNNLLQVWVIPQGLYLICWVE